MESPSKKPPAPSDAPAPPENQPPPHMPPPQVSPDLMDHLHQAGDHFHTGRKHLEETLEQSEYDHQNRINEVKKELADDEKEIEAVDQKIHEELNEELKRKM